jgi:hypothetical protein
MDFFFSIVERLNNYVYRDKMTPSAPGERFLRYEIYT